MHCRALVGSASTARVRAAEALGMLRDARAVEPLIKAMGDEYTVVRLAAAEALGKLGDARAVIPLIKALGDLIGDVSTVAAEALGKLGDARAVIPLVKELGHSTENVRYAAAEALGVLGNAYAVGPLIKVLGDEYKDVRLAAAEALAKLGAPQWTKVIQGNDNDFLRLGESGDAGAVVPLINALGYTNKNVRLAAAEALGKLGDSRVAEPLIKALLIDELRHDDIKAMRQGDKYWCRLKEAAELLGNLGDAGAVVPLINALGYTNKNVRLASAEALVKLGGACAVEPLIKALGDSNYYRSEMAAHVLGKLGDARAVEPLIKALDYSSHKTTVIEALGTLGDARAVEPLIKCFGAPIYRRDYAFEALLKIDDGFDVYETLIKAFGKADYFDKLWAAKALWTLGDTRAVELLIKALDDRSSGFFSAAAQVLGDHGDARAVEPLIESLGDPHLRTASADTLAKLGEPIWKERIWNKNDSNETDSIRRLAESGDPRAVLPLIKLLGHIDTYVRREAAEALGKFGDTRAVEPLIKALRNPDVCGCAVAALGKLGDARAVLPLIEVLRDSYKGHRKAAAEVLVKLGDTRAEEPLINALGLKDNQGVYHLAGNFLRNIHGDTGIIDILLDLYYTQKADITDALVELREVLIEINDQRIIGLLTDIFKYDQDFFGGSGSYIMYILVGLRHPITISEIFDNPNNYIQSGSRVWIREQLLAHALHFAPDLASQEQLDIIEAINDSSYEKEILKDIEPYSTGDHDYAVVGRTTHVISYESERRMARNEKDRRIKMTSRTPCGAVDE